MDNKLIKTDTVWYRINNFFRNLFNFKKLVTREKSNEVSIKENIEKQKVYEENFRKILAENLVNGEVVIADLTDKEVDEMIEFFIKKIEEIDSELVRKKENILRMKSNLGEKQNL